jgi:phosphoribosylformylglycinamidine cyclo-ligase
MKTNAYAQAGVDIAAGERAVELMKADVARTHGPEVLGGIGGFAGLFDAAALKAYDHPVLVTSTDGVGTKVALATALDQHDTIGFDLVGMLVDDLVVVGAKPLFVTDYIACGAVVPERIAVIVKGIADACLEAGAALVGGETAEHPDLLDPLEYDVAGATTGVVERAALLGPHRVQPGDRVLALASSGLHSNGYSLVRHLLRQTQCPLDRVVPEFGRTLGEELLTPTRVYAQRVLAAIAGHEVHAMSHITGGGLAANLARVIPGHLAAEVDRTTWTPPPVFAFLQHLGALSDQDMESTLNMGVGFAVVLPAAALEPVRAALAGQGVAAWDCGSVRPRAADEAAVALVGRHQAG